MQVQSKEYQEHTIFGQLDNYITFYEKFSFLIMLFITSGTTAICNIDTYVYSSMSGTLDSIKLVLTTDANNYTAQATKEKLADPNFDAVANANALISLPPTPTIPNCP